MMKFFRKYTKQLLAVFMALLLVVWLGGSALQSWFDRSGEHLKTPRAKVFGETVLIGDMQGPFRQTEVLKSLGIEWEWMWAMSVARLGARNMQELQQLVGMVRQTPLTLEEWYMLDAAARHSGIQVSDEQLERFKLSRRLTGEALAAVRDKRGYSLDTLDEAIRSYVRVSEMLESAVGAIKASEADIQDVIRDAQEKASVSVVTFDATKFVDSTWQPTPEELQKQFDEGKDKDPSPSTMGEQVFGYREPEKAQIEYIRIDAAALAKRQKISDEVAFEYWEAHQDEFLKPASQPASAPAAPQPKPEKYGTFTEAKPKVIEQLAQRAAQTEAQRLANEIISTLTKPWTGATTTQPDNYATPPAGQGSADVYPNLVASLEPRYPGVLKYARTTLQSQRELEANMEIGYAMFRGSGQMVRLPQAAFMVAGLEAKKGANPDHTRLFRNVYQTCTEPFADFSGGVIVFRTVATKAKESAQSVDSVREKLVTDLRKIRAGKEVERLAKELADKAGTAGLKAAFESDANLVNKLGATAYKDRVTFARGARGVPEFRNDSELVKKCFAVATAPASSTSQPASRIITQQLKGQSNWVVVEWQKMLPVTTQEYDDDRAMAIVRVIGSRQLAFMRNWFDPIQIRERVGWQDLTAGKDVPTGLIETPVIPPSDWGS